MGLLDNVGSTLKGALVEVKAAAVPALISVALAKTNLGSLQGLLSKLQESGLEGQVQSWLGNGANVPITPEQIRAALGNEQVKQEEMNHVRHPHQPCYSDRGRRSGW